jgi:hypothetical protein
MAAIKMTRTLKKVETPCVCETCESKLESRVHEENYKVNGKNYCAFCFHRELYTTLLGRQRISYTMTLLHLLWAAHGGDETNPILKQAINKMLPKFIASLPEEDDDEDCTLLTQVCGLELSLVRGEIDHWELADELISLIYEYAEVLGFSWVPETGWYTITVAPTNIGEEIVVEENEETPTEENEDDEDSDDPSV